MNVGLPGTGIGGLFYLITALLMPVIELVRTFQGQSSLARWRRVGRQTGMAGGIVGCLWATGYAVEHIAMPAQGWAHAVTAGQVTQAMGVSPSVWTYATLGSILVAVELGRWWFGRSGHLQHAPGDS
jgi:hypothetical protein